MHFITLGLTAAFLLGSAHGQSANDNVLGCIDVECPPKADGSVVDDCNVAGSSYSYIGLSGVLTTDENLSGISWTQGLNTTNKSDGGYTYQNAFYLGTPLNFDLSDRGACSVFFNGISSSLSFGPSAETAEGTCADAMGSDCASALVNQAKTFLSGLSLASGNTSADDACSQLQKEFAQNFDQACDKLASDHAWTGLKSNVLAGESDAPQPLTETQNSSSDCWPVLLKQNQLTYVAGFESTSGSLVDDISAHVFAITPILTVFYPMGNGSVLRDVDASMTCLKVVGPPRASLPTMNNGGGDGEGDGIMIMPPATMVVALLAIVSVFLLA